MEGVLERDDASAWLAGKTHLDRGLVGLGTRVRQEDRGSLWSLGQGQQLLGKVELRPGGEEVRNVGKGRGLMADGLNPCGMRIAQGVDGNTAEQIEVLLAVTVDDDATVTAFQAQLGAAEHAEQVAPVALPPSASRLIVSHRHPLRRSHRAGPSFRLPWW